MGGWEGDWTTTSRTLLWDDGVHFGLCRGHRHWQLLSAGTRRHKLVDHFLYLWPEDVVDFGIHHLGHNSVYSLFQHARSKRDEFIWVLSSLISNLKTWRADVKKIKYLLQHKLPDVVSQLIFVQLGAPSVVGEVIGDKVVHSLFQVQISWLQNICKSWMVCALRYKLYGCLFNLPWYVVNKTFVKIIVTVTLIYIIHFLKRRQNAC